MAEVGFACEVGDRMVLIAKPDCRSSDIAIHLALSAELLPLLEGWIRRG